MTTYKYKHVSWCLDPGARGPGALGALNNLVVSGACRLGPGALGALNTLVGSVAWRLVAWGPGPRWLQLC